MSRNPQRDPPPKYDNIQEFSESDDDDNTEDTEDDNSQPPKLPPLKTADRAALSDNGLSDTEVISPNYENISKYLPKDPKMKNFNNDVVLEALSSQIDINTSLTEHLHEIELKYKSLNEQFKEKDEELRIKKQEIIHLTNLGNESKEEIFQEHLKVEKMEKEIKNLKGNNEVIVNIGKEKEDLLRELEAISNDNKQLSQIIEEKDQHIKALEDEIENSKGMHENLDNQNYSLQEHLYEANTLIDKQKKSIENLTKELEINHEIRSKSEQLVQEIKLLKRDTESLNQEKDTWKQQTDRFKDLLKSKDEQLKLDQINVQRDVEVLKRKNGELTKIISDQKTHYLQMLSYFLREVRNSMESAEVFQTNLDQFSHEMDELKEGFYSLKKFENGKSEQVFSEFQKKEEEREFLLTKFHNSLNHNEELEVHLEEMRAKAIMTEELKSKLEKQVQDTKRKATASEDFLEQDKEKIRKLHTQLDSLKEQIHYSSNDSAEKETLLSGQVKYLTKSVRSLQSQLNSTKELLDFVQDERKVLTEEKERLRNEIHEMMDSRNLTNPYVGNMK